MPSFLKLHTVSDGIISCNQILVEFQLIHSRIYAAKLQYMYLKSISLINAPVPRLACPCQRASKLVSMKITKAFFTPFEPTSAYTRSCTDSYEVKLDGVYTESAVRSRTRSPHIHRSSVIAARTEAHSNYTRFDEQ